MLFYKSQDIRSDTGMTSKPIHSFVVRMGFEIIFFVRLVFVSFLSENALIAKLTLYKFQQLWFMVFVRLWFF